MRILCVCNSGNVRSACLARMFRKRGYEAMQMGVDKEYSDETLIMMFNWADKIVIQKDAAQKLEKRALDQKMKYLNAVFPAVRLVAERKFDFRFDLGKDDFYQPGNSLLVSIARKLIEDNPFEEKVEELDGTRHYVP